MLKNKKGIQWLLVLLVMIAIGYTGYSAYDQAQERKALEAEQEKMKKEREATEKKQERQGMDSSDEMVPKEPDAIPAPAFSASNLSGQKVDLASYKGQKVVLNFWASWCPPCKAEVPHLVKYKNEQAAEQNTEIVAVNLTFQDDGIDSIQSFVKEYGMNFPVLLDEKGDIAPQYSIMTIPTTFILNEEGIIEHQITGPVTDDILTELIDEIDSPVKK